MIKDEKTVAEELLCSIRGSFIISQALYLAIQKLEEEKDPYKEVSNIKDMKLLLTLFPIYPTAVNTQERITRERKEVESGKRKNKTNSGHPTVRKGSK